MEIKLFGYTLTFEKTCKAWTDFVIRDAKKAAKRANIDVYAIADENGVSWKIQRIRAIRLLCKPYPEGIGWNIKEDGSSTLCSAKEFVERFWWN